MGSVRGGENSDLGVRGPEFKSQHPLQLACCMHCELCDLGQVP